MIVYWVPTKGGYKTEFKWGRALAVVEVDQSGEDEWDCVLTFDGSTDEAMTFTLHVESGKAARKTAAYDVQRYLYELLDQDGASFDPLGKIT